MFFTTDRVEQCNTPTYLDLMESILTLYRLLGHSGTSRNGCVWRFEMRGR